MFFNFCFQIVRKFFCEVFISVGFCEHRDGDQYMRVLENIGEISATLANPGCAVVLVDELFKRRKQLIKVNSQIA